MLLFVPVISLASSDAFSIKHDIDAPMHSCMLCWIICEICSISSNLQVSKTEQGAQSLIETLRELPSSHALKLRAEIALNLAAAKAQRASLDRQIYKLSKKGF